ncbi:MAG: DUF4430 domain-containing protein [Clostridia bacterium]|nr:DUF4430 domain-containing protein [Clostridia bacterium]
MKRFIKPVLCLLLISVMCSSFAACGAGVDEKGAWESATYSEDMTFGNGSKTVLVEVRAEDRSVTFTIKTDKEKLDDALLEHNLISGENGPYGLYVKSVNGITADYNVNQTYWAFTKNGESMPTGVSGAEISDGEHYELVCTK